MVKKTNKGLEIIFGFSVNKTKEVRKTKKVRLPLKARSLREAKRKKITIDTIFDFIAGIGFKPKKPKETILVIFVKHRKQANLVRKRINQIKADKDCKIYYIYLNEQDSKERIKRLFYSILSWQVRDVLIMDCTNNNLSPILCELLNSFLKIWCGGSCKLL